LVYIGWNWVETQGTALIFAINDKVAASPGNGLGPKPDIPKGTFIAAPVVFGAAAREIIMGEPNNWFYAPANAVRGSRYVRPITQHRCVWPDTKQLRRTNRDLEAFLFWSRAPFTERAPDGSVLVRDARYYDPRARDRFTVELTDVRCQPIATSARAEPVEGPERGASGLRQAQPERDGVE
jgi:inner membrane protein